MKYSASSRHLCLALLLGCAHPESQAQEGAERVEAKPASSVIPPDINGFKTIIPAPEKTRPIKVAIYEGKGALRGGLESVESRIQSIPQAAVIRVPAEQMATIDLNAFDVVVFTGGSGKAQADAIGEVGRNNVREYVRGGGGYLGVCAGAYLACANFSWGLGILNASTISGKWQRGKGFMDAELTSDGRTLLGEVNGLFKVRYGNGPIIKPADRTDLPPYTTLALYRSEISENGTPPGIMVNSPAQALATFGQGRVFISSPHPENTPGLENLIPRAVLWAARSEAAAAAAPSSPRP